MKEMLQKDTPTGGYSTYRTVRQNLTVIFSCLTALPFFVFAFVYFQLGALHTALSGALIALALILVLQGFIIFRRMAEHIERLSWTMEQAESGKLIQAHEAGETRELAVIADTFNRTLSKLEEKARDLEVALVSQKKAQDQILASARMAAYGELSLNIAHELNNPLTAILGYAELTLGSPLENDEIRMNLEMIRSQATRAGEITRALLDFFNTESGLRVSTDLNDLVRKTLRLMQGSIAEKGIHIDLRLAEPSLFAMADPGQMGQVFFNLMNNAVNAMTGKYPVPAGADKREPQSDRAKLLLKIESRERNGKAHIAFTDTGCGIAPDDLGRIFDPFFSTQERVSRVGLGLWVSYRIVEGHAGKIHVKSVPGKGSVFVVVLPMKLETGELKLET